MAAPKNSTEPANQPTVLMPDELKYDADGLIPAVIQDSGTGAVLMVAYMNREALQRTLDSGKVWFWSRSRRVYWLKGESSGNIMAVQAIYGDCDADTILVQVAPRGPGVACHTGRYSCFFNPLAGFEPPPPESVKPTGVLTRLAEVIKNRRAARPAGSYTARLIAEGSAQIARKFGEEALEVIIAYLQGGRAELTREGADLLYHLLVMLEEADLPLDVVLQELAERGRSGA